MLDQETLNQETRDKLTAFVLNPFEDRQVDMKGPEEWGAIKFKLARCALGMANLTIDGLIVVGVEDLRNGQFVRHGLTSLQAKTFDPDIVKDFLASFMSPPVETEAGQFDVEGKTYFGVRVDCHSHRPVVAAKGNSGAGQDNIVAEAIYCRPIGVRPQTRKATPQDMELVIREHIESGVKAELEKLQRLGLVPTQAGPKDVPTPAGYAKEREGFI